jgi:TRAP-type C4-dicarboxylate transport system permease small subunit
METMDRFIDRLCGFFGLLMVVALAFMVVMVFGNVVLRYGFNSSIAISEELSRWLFVWLTFIGAIVAVRRRLHLGSDLLVSRLSPGGRRTCFVLSRILMLYMCWLMGRGAWQQTLINWGTTSAVMQASVAWFFGVGVLFAAVAGVFLLLELWKVVTGRLRDDELIAVTESEEHATASSAGGGAGGSQAGKP